MNTKLHMKLIIILGICILLSGCTETSVIKEPTEKELKIDSIENTNLETYIQNNLNEDIKIIKEETIGNHKRIKFEEDNTIKRVIINNKQYGDINGTD